MLSNEMLCKVQSKELEILLEIKRICDENNITYFLAYGTLIGAIRHKGFIPWDDDIDIIMKRDDYERFLKIAPAQITDKYFIESSKSNCDYVYSFCKVKANGTIFKEGCTANTDIHPGIWVDVFPLDYLQDLNYKKTDKATRKIAMWQTAIDYNAGIIKLEKPITKLFFKFITIIFNHKLLLKKEKLMQSFNTKNHNYVVDFNWSSRTYKKSIFEKKVFDETINVEFEGHTFTAPREYDTILKQIYGNYMKLPPEDKRITHHTILEVKV